MRPDRTGKRIEQRSFLAQHLLGFNKKLGERGQRPPVIHPGSELVDTAVELMKINQQRVGFRGEKIEKGAFRDLGLGHDLIDTNGIKAGLAEKGQGRVPDASLEEVPWSGAISALRDQDRK